MQGLDEGEDREKVRRTRSKEIFGTLGCSARNFNIWQGDFWRHVLRNASDSR